MRRFFYTAMILFACSFVHAQPSVDLTSRPDTKISVTEKTIYYNLADNIVPIKIQQYGETDTIVFISLHDDEFTSVDAAKKILEEKGGLLIEVENNLQRNIRFNLGNYFYQVDPNRIFSKEGIKKSLEEFGRSSPKAIDQAFNLGRRIIQLIPADATCIIALHNNTPDQFSVTEYSAGNKRSDDSKKVYINSRQDADDFFLTTDNDLYEQLADKGFNIILQDNNRCTEDGSLSVYCGKKNIRYVNCETEHGKTGQYVLMITNLIKSL